MTSPTILKMIFLIFAEDLKMIAMSREFEFEFESYFARKFCTKQVIKIFMSIKGEIDNTVLKQ